MFALPWRARSHRPRASRVYRPTAESLDGRVLLSTTVLINDDTPGYYNDHIGHKLDDTGQPQFPTVDDPTLNRAAAPDLSAPAVAAVLGAWLGPNPVFNANWSGPQAIPTSWPVSTENAIVYPFTVAAGNTMKLTGNFGVDNGIFVWVDGRYQFGAEAPGGYSRYDYPNVDLGTAGPGTHYVQIIREDHGTIDGSTLEIVGEATAAPAGTVQFSAPRYDVGEADGRAAIVVSRVGGTAGALSATFAAHDGTARLGEDYGVPAPAITVTFADGDAAPKTVLLPIDNDARVEGDETVNLTLDGPALGTPAKAVLTIHDVPPLRLPRPTAHFLMPEFRVRENGLRARITVVLDHAWDQPLTVTYATRPLARHPRRGQATEGKDYLRATGALTFAPGQTAQEVFIILRDDNRTEGDERLGLDLRDPATGQMQSATLVIVDARRPRKTRRRR